MKVPKTKIVVIVGPTASGKSELAVKIAKKFNGEIISSDSRQVYQKLDVGTGKVRGKWRTWKPRFQALGNGVSKSWVTKKVFVYKNIPHYCIDFVSPKKIFTAAEYKKCAQNAISDTTGRGKIPIIAGGTGFYIDALVKNISLPEVPPNIKLRNKFEKKSIAELMRVLKKLDPRRTKTVDRLNPRRIIRSIEIAKAIGFVPKLKTSEKYDVLWIGISARTEKLRILINRRLRARLKSGLIKEAQRLRKHGLPWKRFYQLGLEYKFLADYLRGKISKEDMVFVLERAIYKYSRRQMTWFRKNKEIHWIKNTVGAEQLIKSFLKTSRAQTYKQERQHRREDF